MNEFPILLYTTPEGGVKVNAVLKDETLWLTQGAMAELFGVQKAAISKHLKNIFESGELVEGVVVSKMETTTRQLAFSRQFYRVYPIVNALRSQLNWTQYRLLIQMDDPQKREYYELESVNHCWTARETERQVNSQLWERLCLSNDKATVLAVARKERLPESPIEIIKDPQRLEFLGLERKAKYYETDLEQSIIDHLQEYMMELGDGSLFSARQKRILLDDKEFFVDLVFYNRLLKCFVIIELKTGELTHQDLGQLQMYGNYYDRKVKLPEEN